MSENVGSVKPVLTVSMAEFCRLTGLGKTSAYACVRTGSVQSVLVGRRRLVLMSSIEQLLDPTQTAAK